MQDRLRELIARRFGEARDIAAPPDGADTLHQMLARRSCRHFAPRPVPDGLLDLICAAALAAPSKSDLQQRDIIAVRDRALRDRLDAITGQAWLADAPVLLVFCGNNRRQRLLHAWRGRDFANDHLDAFFNAAVDAAIALAACVAAAEAAGLGACPVSTIRNRPDEAAGLLGLPDHVFPVAGLALGFPADPGARPPVPRLPLSATLHRDRYADHDLRETVRAYDRVRARDDPPPRQRRPEIFGVAEVYDWSEDKTRQYSLPERGDFGKFVRSKGFSLD